MAAYAKKPAPATPTKGQCPPTPACPTRQHYQMAAAGCKGKGMK